MSLTSKLQKLKQEKLAKRSVSRNVSNGPMVAATTWLLVGLCLVLVAVCTLAYYEFFVCDKIPPALA